MPVIWRHAGFRILILRHLSNDERTKYSLFLLLRQPGAACQKLCCPETACDDPQIPTKVLQCMKINELIHPTSASCRAMACELIQSLCHNSKCCAQSCCTFLDASPPSILLLTAVNAACKYACKYVTKPQRSHFKACRFTLIKVALFLACFISAPFLYALSFQCWC